MESRAKRHLEVAALPGQSREGLELSGSGTCVANMELCDTCVTLKGHAGGSLHVLRPNLEFVTNTCVDLGLKDNNPKCLE